MGGLFSPSQPQANASGGLGVVQEDTEPDDPAVGRVTMKTRRRKLSEPSLSSESVGASVSRSGKRKSRLVPIVVVTEKRRKRVKSEPAEEVVERRKDGDEDEEDELLLSPEEGKKRKREEEEEVEARQCEFHWHSCSTRR
jgi:hypothetical protein